MAKVIPPGYVFTSGGGDDTMLNPKYIPIILTVTNTGDRPIQVGSHYHFVETNPYLKFDRVVAYGRRLNICSGTAVRFEPSEQKSISLVPIGGRQCISGGNNLVQMLTSTSSVGEMPSSSGMTTCNILKKGRMGSCGEEKKKTSGIGADGVGTIAEIGNPPSDLVSKLESLRC